MFVSKKAGRVVVFLGLCGMFLSEVGVWNVKQFAGVMAARGAASALALLPVAGFVYFLLAAAFCDLAARYRAGRPLALILLGSVFGIVNEAVFAPVVFGGGPLGVNWPVLAFTSLFWHPLFCFYGSVGVARYLFSYPDNAFSGRAFAFREKAAFFAGGFAWYSMLYMPWQYLNFPGGVPLSVRPAGLAFPALVFGYAALFIEPGPPSAAGAASGPSGDGSPSGAALDPRAGNDPGRVLTPGGTAFVWGSLAFFAAVKSATLFRTGSGAAAAALATLGYLYFRLFAAVAAAENEPDEAGLDRGVPRGAGREFSPSPGRPGERMSHNAEAGPPDGGAMAVLIAAPLRPCFGAFLHAWAIVALAHAACHAVSASAPFAAFIKIASRTMVLFALAFAAVVPLAGAAAMKWRFCPRTSSKTRRAKRPGQSSQSG